MARRSRDDPPGAGYLRAAGRAPLALYDPFVAVAMRERLFRARLARQVLAGWAGDGRRRGVTICDVGCGTGTLSLALAGVRGVAAVIAVDGDPAALARARAKAARSGGWAVEWREGMAQRLPLEDKSCDRVVLSLVLHHLSPADQRAALREAARVLRPGGRVHVADWGRPRDPLMRVAFRLLQLVDGAETTAPLGRGELPAMLDAAGFADQRLHDRLRTAGGLLELRSARRG
ncbi:class I SAM-dependent methyltransferase [Conexibacter arvalis]|uniref:SAM-dependent methyltransferase n=1 Tax=Conexibacter arvalis TaxID=912552 RepID=A0A840IFI5_9ACTN|nr:class I SAM-dependent methyltransferase [Conexibacter arvalis]MBB4662953.1 SAM-dependent methyltransferase [Conexibacter arvalis]